MSALVASQPPAVLVADVQAVQPVQPSTVQLMAGALKKE
jgi:hypothetical protein